MIPGFEPTVALDELPDFDVKSLAAEESHLPRLRQSLLLRRSLSKAHRVVRPGGPAAPQEEEQEAKIGTRALDSLSFSLVQWRSRYSFHAALLSSNPTISFSLACVIEL